MSQLAIAFRILRRQGLYGITAILGLSVGIMVAVIALLYTWQETHYDSHIPNADRLALVDLAIDWPRRDPVLQAQLPGPMKEAALEGVPGIEAATRVYRQYSTVKTADNENFNDIIAGVDSNFADLLGFQMISGESASLANPSNVLISESMAERIFGRTDVAGEIVTVPPHDLTVGGVFADWPDMSHMTVDIVMNYQAQPIRLPEDYDTNWSLLSGITYVLLDDNADLGTVQQSVNDLFLNRYISSEPLPDGAAANQIFKLELEPLSGLHLSGKDYSFAIKPPADMLRLTVLGAIALLIILVACINHINMATVRASERAREVAVRKLLGAGRGTMALQFLIESAVVVLVALLLALVSVELIAGPVGELLDTTINVGLLIEPGFLIWLILLSLFVTLAAGAYPALMASAFPPGRILQSHARGRSGGTRLRTILVVFQFAVSIVLAVGAAAIYDQLKFAREADLGYNSDGVVMLYGIQRWPEFTIELSERVRRSIEGKPGILAVSGANSSPGIDYVPEADLRPMGSGPNETSTVGAISVGVDYFDILNIKPLAGRTFSNDYGIDRTQWNFAERMTVDVPVILNERAVRMLGYASPQEAVGQAVQFTRDVNYDRPGQIVGVVPDIYFESFRTVVRPMVYYPDPTLFGAALVKIDPNNSEVGMQSINEGWKEVFTNQGIAYDFLSAALIKSYESESKELRTVTILAGLGILIAMFGQYGLAAYSAQSRRREISIRKVLGAKISDIVKLFAWQFSKPVFVAMFVAWPFAFVAADLWLENFVYRTAIDPLWFILAGVSALVVALLTMMGHAVKAAQAHPVEALRYE